MSHGTSSVGLLTMLSHAMRCASRPSGSPPLASVSVARYANGVLSQVLASACFLRVLVCSASLPAFVRLHCRQLGSREAVRLTSAVRSDTDTGATKVACCEIAWSAGALTLWWSVTSIEHDRVARLIKLCSIR